MSFVIIPHNLPKKVFKIMLNKKYGSSTHFSMIKKTQEIIFFFLLMYKILYTLPILSRSLNIILILIQ